MKENLKRCACKLREQFGAFYRFSGPENEEEAQKQEPGTMRSMVRVDACERIPSRGECVERVHCDRVLFVERSGELRVLARLRGSAPEPEGNQVLTERKSADAGPKPGDLSMSRLKPL